MSLGQGLGFLFLSLGYHPSCPAAMSSVTKLTASDAASFDAALARAHGGAGVLLVLFTGSSDASGVSWCPDCTDSKPVLEAALRAAEVPITLITVPLPREEYRGNAGHWARCVARVRERAMQGSRKALGAGLVGSRRQAANGRYIAGRASLQTYAFSKRDMPRPWNAPTMASSLCWKADDSSR